MSIVRIVGIAVAGSAFSALVVYAALRFVTGDVTAAPVVTFAIVGGLLAGFLQALNQAEHHRGG